MSLLDSIIENHGSAPKVLSTQNDLNKINWVAGLSDPGEMIGCGMYQQLRRHAGEADAAYQARIEVELQALPADVRNKITTAMKAAATKRAGLDTSGGRVRVMVAGQLPWHGLGVNVDKAVTSEEAIKLAGLDWDVKKVQLHYSINGVDHVANDTFGIVRLDTDEYLGSVGSRYKPIQNVHGFDFLDGVLSDFGAKYETAGSLYGGKQVWMLAHLPKQAFTINGGDEIEPYVIFSNCHDGSGSAWCYPTSVRVVCANTFRLSKGEKSKGLSIRHTGNVKDKIKVAQTALGFAVQSFEQFKEDAETMYHKKIEIESYASELLDAVLDITQAEVDKGADVLAAAITKDSVQRDLEVKKLQKKIDKREKVLEEILERYEGERCGFGDMRGTAWAGFNAVTEYADHSKQGRKVGDEEERASRRFESVLIGEMDNMKQVAYEMAMKA